MLLSNSIIDAIIIINIIIISVINIILIIILLQSIATTIFNRNEGAKIIFINISCYFIILNAFVD